MDTRELSERERRVLEAVIETYVETAEPAGSRTIARRSGLGVSAATIRNTMSDLEEKGYLFHPHASAGRIPTDRAYRLYVDQLARIGAVEPSEAQTLHEELASQGSAIEAVLQCAAKVLGVLTQELGLAAAPTFDEARLERLELIHVGGDRLLLVLTLRSGVAKSIFVDLRSALPLEAVANVARVLNDRLAGLTLRDIRASVADRLRDAASDSGHHELLNIFIQEAEGLFQDVGEREVVLGSARMLAEQPEFASNERMRHLLALTERRDLLGQALRKRTGSGLTITIGSEHESPELSPFTLVTASYRSGPLSGVIGVIGPTRMPYDKIIAMVDHTSRLIGELLP